MPSLGFSRVQPLIILLLFSFVSCELFFKRPYFPQAKKYERLETQITKVSLTQKGYIQFLRYTVDVPTIEEFTYCIWLNSLNFTYSHPLLSYSKNEKERLIRGWIGPSGKTINLEILEVEAYSVQVEFVENRWYHICQSWDSPAGTWMLFIDGKLREEGANDQLKNMEIPNGGDVVVGQEYTDFEKGLDDGIEGDIFGFNLLLVSALDKQTSQERQLNELLPQRRQTYLPTHQMPSSYQMNMRRRNSHIDYYRRDAILTPPIEPVDVPEVLGYFNINREPKGIFEFGQSIFNMLLGEEGKKPVRYSYPKRFYVGKRITSGIKEFPVSKKSLGLVLVEESYNNCAKGNGSPISGEKVLISWTRTPIRVFGGALLKLVPPFCIKIS